MTDRVFQLCDTVRETGFAIHRYLGPGHLEKVYENALVHRLRKQGPDVKQQHPLKVYDEDGTVLGEYSADLFVENSLIVELKAARATADEHVAQILGYLRAAHIEHGLLVNFGAPKFYVKKYAMTDPTSPSRGLSSWLLTFLLLFASFCVLCGHIHAAELGVDWERQAAEDAKHDRIVIAYDGLMPNKVVCDTTLRELPDGFVSRDKQWLHFGFDDNRHRAVYVGAKLPPLP